MAALGSTVPTLPCPQENFGISARCECPAETTEETVLTVNRKALGLQTPTLAINQAEHLRTLAVSREARTSLDTIKQREATVRLDTSGSSSEKQDSPSDSTQKFTVLSILTCQSQQQDDISPIFLIVDLMLDSSRTDFLSLDLSLSTEIIGFLPDCSSTTLSRTSPPLPPHKSSSSYFPSSWHQSSEDIFLLIHITTYFRHCPSDASPGFLPIATLLLCESFPCPCFYPTKSPRPRLHIHAPHSHAFPSLLFLNLSFFGPHHSWRREAAVVVLFFQPFEFLFRDPDSYACRPPGTQLSSNFLTCLIIICFSLGSAESRH